VAASREHPSKKIVYIYVQVVTKNGNEICLNEVDKDKNAKLNKKH
jgi:hypothetical protein